MTTYILRRLIQIFPLLLLISMIGFWIVQATGDPLQLIRWILPVREIWRACEPCTAGTNLCNSNMPTGLKTCSPVIGGPLTYRTGFQNGV